MSFHKRARSAHVITGLRVEVHNGNFEKALRQFTKKVNDSGKLREVKERMEYVKPSVKRRKAKQAAVKRTIREHDTPIDSMY